MTNRFTDCAPDTLCYSDLAGTLTQADVDTSDKLIRDNSPVDLREFCEENTVLHYLGERAFKALVQLPDNDNFNGNVVAVPTGMFADINPASVTQARIIREIVDPNAALVVLANSSPFNCVNNFSLEEMNRLRKGNAEPYLDRLNTIFDAIPGAERIAYSCASLAASIGSAALASERIVVPASAATFIEPAHIVNRHAGALLIDFEKSFTDLEDTLDLDAPEEMTGKELDKEFKYKFPKQDRDEQSFLYESVGSPLRAVAENLAVVGILNRDRLKRDLMATPKGVGKVHAWAKASKISPDRYNREISWAMADDPYYKRFVINNANVKHGMTVAFPVHAALLRAALRLSDFESAWQ